jgi:hypothetical protein
VFRGLERAGIYGMRLHLTRHPLGRRSLGNAAQRAGALFACLLLPIEAAHVGDGAAPAPMPEITVCEAFERPRIPSGGMVRIRGRLNVGFEIFALESDACQADERLRAMIWLVTQVKDRPIGCCATAREVMWAQINGRTEDLAASIEWFHPVPVEFQQDANWEQLTQILESRRGTVMVSVVGRLDTNDRRAVTCDDDGNIQSAAAGYGHGSGFSRRLVIERVESVELQAQ